MSNHRINNIPFLTTENAIFHNLMNKWINMIESILNNVKLLVGIIREQVCQDD